MTPLEETLQRMTLLYPVTVVHDSSVQHPYNVSVGRYDPHTEDADRWVMHGTAMVHTQQINPMPGNPGASFKIEAVEFIPVAVPDAGVAFTYTKKGAIIGRRRWEYNGLPGAREQPLHGVYSWDRDARQMRLAGSVELGPRRVIDLGIPAEFQDHTYRTVQSRFPEAAIIGIPCASLDLNSDQPLQLDLEFRPAA